MGVGISRWINFCLALFNLVATVPLDGWRMLHAAFWAWTVI
jgi:Zn-dependent protease